MTRARALAALLLAATACSRSSAEKREGTGARPDATAASRTAAPLAPSTSGPPQDDSSATAPAIGPVAPPNEATVPGPTGEPSAPPAAPLEAKSADALLAEVRKLGGKGTLINAWASWCGPCKHEIPMLQKLAQELAPRGVHVLLVSLDEPADVEKAGRFLSEHQVTLKSYVAERPLGVFKQGLNPRWPGMLPASFLYDASGSLRYYWGGEAFEAELRPVLDALAAGKPIQGEASEPVAPEGEVH